MGLGPLPQLATLTRPEVEERTLDTAHLLRRLGDYQNVLCFPVFSNLGAEAADARDVRVQFRRPARDPVPAATAVAGDVFDNTCNVRGANDASPDGTAGEQNYQRAVRARITATGSATLSLTPAGSGTVEAGTGTRTVTVLSANPAGDDGDRFDLRISDTVAETVQVTVDVLDQPSIPLSLRVVFA